MAAVRARHRARRAVETLADVIDDVARLARNASARVASLQAAVAAALAGDLIAAAGPSALVVAAALPAPVFCSSLLQEVRQPLYAAGLAELLGAALAQARMVQAQAERLHRAVGVGPADLEAVAVVRDRAGPVAFRYGGGLLRGEARAEERWCAGLRWGQGAPAAPEGEGEAPDDASPVADDDPDAYEDSVEDAALDEAGALEALAAAVEIAVGERCEEE